MWFDNKAKAHFDEGLALIASRKYEDAMREFTLALSYNPTAICYVQRANLFAKFGDLYNLEQDVRRARELSAQSAVDERLLGEIEKLEQRLTANSDEQKALEKEVEKALKQEKLNDLLGLYGFAGNSKRILSMAKPAARLSTTSSKTITGQSKLGGLPDLPEGCEWPVLKGKKARPLSFIVQLNFGEANRFCKDNGLPSEGTLYYFYDAESQPWGGDENDRFGWHALYVKDANKASLRATDPPMKCQVFPQYALASQEFTSLPAPSSTEITKLRLSETRRDQYTELYDLWQRQTDHQVLGHPNLIQNPMEDQLQGPKNDWILLLQIASQDEDHDGKGMMWGDGGKLYVWIRKDDLQRNDFNNIWTILQCF